MIVLGDTRYGKSEVRLLRVNRGPETDEILDLSVSIALRGDFGASYTDGDNSAVLTTDAQKNTVFAFADRYGVESPEAFARLLAEHFTASVGSVTQARVRVERYPWDRVAGRSFARSGGYVRTATVTTGDPVEGGLRGLTLLNTAGSEFRGFLRDEYTTLAETGDRILATDVDASWRYATDPPSWDAAFEAARDELIGAFAGTYSHSLQQTLFAMGRAVLERLPEVAEIRLVLPNKHHFEQGSHDVYYASDRPYGLIEGTVTRGLWSSNRPPRSTTRSRSRPPGRPRCRWPAAPT
jgi:urate oxidase